MVSTIVMKKVYGKFLCLRIFMAAMSWSYHQPDETWQSVEVAHKLVFGNGELTWEWEWGIRSWLHPLIFSLPFWLLKITRWDCYTHLVVIFPRITQAIINAAGDTFILAFCSREFGARVAKWFAFLYLSNWSINYHSSRTLINTLEMAFTSAALYYYPSGKARKVPSWKYISFVTLSFAMRPTTALFWMPMVLYHVSKIRRRKLVSEVVTPAALLYATALLVDSWFYGRFVCVHYNFLMVNVLKGISNFFGTCPWHWYLTVGNIETFGPVVMWDIFMGCYLCFKNPRHSHLGTSYILALAGYSLVPHKETRFALPLVPIALCFAAISFAQKTYDKWGWGMKFKLGLILLNHLPLLIYLSLFHASGSTAAIDYLSQNADVHSSEIAFLMMCHSTPFYSHIHRNFSMRYLHCHPDITTNSYIDESVALYEDPFVWLTKREFGTPKFSPTHLVMFNNLLDEHLESYLGDKGYILCASFYHSSEEFMKFLLWVSENFMGDIMEPRMQARQATRVLVFCQATF